MFWALFLDLGTIVNQHVLPHLISTHKHMLYNLVYFSVPSQPRNIYAVVSGPNTIDVSWEPPSQTRNRVKEYWVYYNDTYLKQENKAVVQGTETKYQLQDLTPDTTYTIKVSALSDKGEGAATRIILATTEPYGMLFVVHFHSQICNEFRHKMLEGLEQEWGYLQRKV